MIDIFTNFLSLVYAIRRKSQDAMKKFTLYSSSSAFRPVD